MKFYDKLRAQYVRRWTTVKATHDQSLAEHSFNVAVLAGEICYRLNMDPYTTNKVVCLALIHDIEEVVTGDIPGPTKRRLDEATRIQLGAYSIEDKNKALHCHLPDNSLLHTVVKAADRLEEALFIEQHGASVGVHSWQVRQQVMDDFERFVQEISYRDVSKAIRDMWNEFGSADRDW